jgi:hypothetical protein
MTRQGEARYTGTHHADGHTDCSAGLRGCQYEQEETCFHCTTPVREHLDEDGSYLLVEPKPARHA